MPPDPAPALPAGRDGARAAGLGYGLAAYIWWGLSPLYFKLLAQVPAHAVLAHRVVWSILLLSLLLTALRQWASVAETARRPGVLFRLTISAILLGINWLVFIYAVGHGRALEASLGYFINPLVTVVLGMIFLGERLRRVQWIALAIAGLGVAWFGWVALERGATPWIALALPASFGLYSLIRKRTAAGPLPGLFLETAVLAPLAVAYLAWFHSEPQAVNSARAIGLLSLSGIVTTVPMVSFVAAARRLPLSTVGFLQYVNPTLQFLVAVLVFAEPFDSVRAAAFAIIWVAVLVYVAGLARPPRADRL